MSDIQVKLRKLTPEDLDFLDQMENDPRYWHLSSLTKAFTREELTNYIQHAHQPIQEAGQERWVITLDDVPCGFIDLYEYDAFHARAGVGIAVSDAFRQKGVAHKALALLKTYCSETLQLHQLYATIPVDNEASITLFKKADFILSGYKKEWIYKDEKWIDAADYQYFF